MGKPYTPRRADDDYTRAVKDGGLQAVREARERRRHGANGEPSQRPTSDLYDDWLESVTPRQQPGATYGYGRTDEGAYSGFRTEGGLKAAVKGRAETLRGADREMFDALNSMAEQGLDRAEGDYEQSWTEQTDRRSASDAGAAASRFGQMESQRQALANYDKNTSGPRPSPVIGSRAASMKAMNAQQATTGTTDADMNAYNDSLNTWLADETAPLLDRQAFAEQGRATPIAAYAQRSGAEYGVDPNIVGGWYPAASQIGDARDQADITSLNETGMTAADYQRALDDMDRDAANADKEAVSQEAQAIDDFVYAATGGVTGAQSLATDLGVSPEDVYRMVDSDLYKQSSDAIYGALATNDADTVMATMEDVLPAVFFQDPALYNVLQAVFRDYIPDGYDPYTG